MPVIVRDLDDDAATIIMVDSNLQRESLLPSERAFAYLRRSHVLVVCGHVIDETVKNDIATAERLRITATTLDGILTVKGQGRGKGGARHA